MRDSLDDWNAQIEPTVAAQNANIAAIQSAASIITNNILTAVGSINGLTGNISLTAPATPGSGLQVVIASAGTTISVTLTVAASINVSTSYKVGTVQVVGARKTGWGNPGGTLSRAAYLGLLAAALPVGVIYSQAEVTAIRDALILISQGLAALLTDLDGATSGHGLIGP